MALLLKLFLNLRLTLINFLLYNLIQTRNRFLNNNANLIMISLAIKAKVCIECWLLFMRFLMAHMVLFSKLKLIWHCLFNIYLRKKATWLIINCSKFLIHFFVLKVIYTRLFYININMEILLEAS
ncbi:unnamed protein product [Blepharisma stoltei]|uniref:Uncharacterized protein n=1 Tax=Blepharisma stoltei TaxID=1481888 RepID=A0AAU9J5E9_9CILI|nr:unnamed protein product [Blepharisma stoltei]